MDILGVTALEDVGRCVIKDADGNPTAVVFLVAGPGHPTRLAFEKKAARRGLREFNKRGKDQLPEDPDELFDRATERLVALTLGWENGEPAYTPASAREIYENRKSSVRRQVAEFLAAEENFSASSSES